MSSASCSRLMLLLLLCVALLSSAIARIIPSKYHVPKLYIKGPLLNGEIFAGSGVSLRFLSANPKKLPIGNYRLLSVEMHRKDSALSKTQFEHTLFKNVTLNDEEQEWVIPKDFGKNTTVGLTGIAYPTHFLKTIYVAEFPDKTSAQKVTWTGGKFSGFTLRPAQDGQLPYCDTKERACNATCGPSTVAYFKCDGRGGHYCQCVKEIDCKWYEKECARRAGIHTVTLFKCSRDGSEIARCVIDPNPPPIPEGMTCDTQLGKCRQQCARYGQPVSVNVCNPRAPQQSQCGCFQGADPKIVCGVKTYPMQVIKNEDGNCQYNDGSTDDPTMTTTKSSTDNSTESGLNMFTSPLENTWQTIDTKGLDATVDDKKAYEDAMKKLLESNQPGHAARAA